jgi:hypothetical protein
MMSNTILNLARSVLNFVCSVFSAFLLNFVVPALPWRQRAPRDSRISGSTNGMQFHRWGGFAMTLFAMVLSAECNFARADNGRDFTGAYSVQTIGAAGSATTRIRLKLQLRNVSGAAVDSAVIEVNASPPGPAAQSFRKSISLADRANVTVSGEFSVATRDALRWSGGGEPAPTIVVIATDATGRAGRHAVELIGIPGGVRP